MITKFQTIRDLPNIDKPREKLIKYGVNKLSNEELLAIILGSGRKGRNVIELSKDILSEFKDVSTIKISNLIKINGLGNAKACKLIAAIELGKRFNDKSKTHKIIDPEDVWKELSEIKSQKKEHFVALYLDSRSQLISKEIISVGTINSSIVHPREVFEPAVKNLAVSIIFAHNHPSGSLEPSIQDIGITKRLIEAGSILGIKVQDHVIISEYGWHSMDEFRDTKFP